MTVCCYAPSRGCYKLDHLVIPAKLQAEEDLNNAMQLFSAYNTPEMFVHLLEHLDIAKVLATPSYLLGAVLSTRLKKKLTDYEVDAWRPNDSYDVRSHFVHVRAAATITNYMSILFVTIASLAGQSWNLSNQTRARVQERSG